jgi:hypothetical protein
VAPSVSVECECCLPGKVRSCSFVDQQRQFREADNLRHAADVKTPDTYLGTTVQALLRLVLVASSTNLPPLWQELADAANAQHRNVVQRHLDEALQRCVPGGTRSHSVHPSLAKKVVSVKF